MHMLLLNIILLISVPIHAFVYKLLTSTRIRRVEVPWRLSTYILQKGTTVNSRDRGAISALSLEQEDAESELDSPGELSSIADAIPEGDENGNIQEQTIDKGQQCGSPDQQGSGAEGEATTGFSEDLPIEGSDQLSMNLKISRRLWKLLMALLIYRSKYGDYMVDPQFAFSDDDEKRLSGYCLGEELNALLENIKLHDTNLGLYKRLMSDPEKSRAEYPTSDIVEAPRLLWLIGFPTATYLNAKEEWGQEVASIKGVGKRIKHSGLISGLGSINREIRETGKTPGESRKEQVKKVIAEYIKDEYEHNRQKMDFKRKQVLPQPSNRARIRPNLFKNIVSELLDIKQNKNPRKLTPRPTRRETEGGHHYAFYHWSFEDVIECMVLFNDMYMDYNRELLIESEKNGTPFKPITFNILKPEWRVPSDDLWPERLWGLPLGIWLDKFRNGDIDAKQHWLRRDVLDHLHFDWGDGLKYLAFTWDKLVLGLLWYIHQNGFPISSMPANLVISNAEVVNKWGKPEEIQGMHLGYVFYNALDHLQVIRKHYPERFEFIREMGLDYIVQDEIDLGYKPLPHRRTTSVSRYLLVSKDGKYLKD